MVNYEGTAGTEVPRQTDGAEALQRREKENKFKNNNTNTNTNS
jgi:hypothetical protein